MSTDNSHKISVTTATIVGMNAMIGAGIFTTTILLASVGAAGILSYLFAFFAVWFIAQSIARAAYIWPQEGSFYTYTYQWAGHKIGLIAAGSYLFGFLCAMTLLCKMAGEYLHNIFPTISAETLGLITLTALVALNMVGVALSQIGQYILIACTLFPLFATTALCLTKINLINLTPFMPFGFFSVIQGTRVAIFGLFGFECITTLFNIVQNPEKNIPRALQASISLVGIIYFCFISSIILSVPLTTFTENANVTIPQALLTIFPGYTFILGLINFAIISAILGTIHSMIWAGSELLLSYGTLTRSAYLKKIVKSGFFTQKTTALLCGIFMLFCFVTINNDDLFFTLTGIGLIFAFILAMISLLFQPSEWKSGQNIKTILGLMTASIIFGISVQKLIESIAIWIR